MNRMESYSDGRFKSIAWTLNVNDQKRSRQYFGLNPEVQYRVMAMVPVAPI